MNLHNLFKCQEVRRVRWPPKHRMAGFPELRCMQVGDGDTGNTVKTGAQLVKALLSGTSTRSPKVWLARLYLRTNRLTLADQTTGKNRWV